MCWLVSSSWCRDSVSCLCAKPFGLPFAVIYSLSLFPLKPVRHSDNRCLRVHLWCASILPEDSRLRAPSVPFPVHPPQAAPGGQRSLEGGSTDVYGPRLTPSSHLANTWEASTSPPHHLSLAPSGQLQRHSSSSCSLGDWERARLWRALLRCSRRSCVSPRSALPVAAAPCTCSVRNKRTQMHDQGEAR